MSWQQIEQSPRASERPAAQSGGLVTEAHVECRGEGGAWWHYASPALGGASASDALRARRREGARLDELAELFLGLAGPDDDLVGALGVPPDLSAYTAERYAMYRARRRRMERAELATWADVRGLDHVLSAFADRMGGSRELVPATYCALLGMMQGLERDFETRVVLWFDSHAAR